METLITARLTFFLESKGRLHPSQHGFRTQHSTETALNAVIKKIEESMDSGMVAYGCSVDIQSAFDAVPFPQIVGAAIDKEVLTYLVRLLGSFTQGRSAVLEINGVNKKIDIQRGTPQGSPMSPTLFAMSIDRILESAAAKGFYAQAYADDIFILSKGNSDEEAHHEMQSAVAHVISEIDKCGLSVNQRSVLRSVSRRDSLRQG